MLFADKVKSLLIPGSRLEKALQRLADANMTSKSASPSHTQDSMTQTAENNTAKVNTIVDTPPTTPSVHEDIYLSKAFKGIPKSLLEKVNRSHEYTFRKVTPSVHHNIHLLSPVSLRIDISGSRETSG